ncbi:glycosyltransferase family 2 protein [Falsirhodobacter algicola]|uniref:Glycosyltransferase family 92 protein n=1 Tax=Falsirhodobacter algicola TaxID=2692330 RepID=A0A8J8SKK6_9RHOB|nr:glycosyltransferase family 2 protein [Falsirhodobacter algicola]QUS35473.1 glycosyltransferase family 92 protein [Falsirhodobacter algicola]
MSLPTVASLWIGGNISYLEQVCLRSFVDHGHRTLLYTYGDVANAPPGVEVLDAEAIYPSSQMVLHKESGSPALVSDVFRYKLLEMLNVIWIDADVLCMRPWTFDSQFVFGWERTNDLICGAVLGLPRFSRTLKQLLNFCRDEYPIPPWADEEERARLVEAAEAGTPVHVSELKWGVWGPAALTHFLKETGEAEHTLPQEAFYPILFKDRRDLLTPGTLTQDDFSEGCYGVHLWNRRVSRRIVTAERGFPHPDSFIGQALVRHNIDPRLAPLPDRPPPGSPTRAELGKTPNLKRAALYGDLIHNPVNVPADAAKIPAPVAPAPAPRPVIVPPAVKDDAPRSGSLRQREVYQEAIDSLEERTATKLGALAPPDAPMGNERIAVLTSMKNEGPFILEWIAYHRAIGVTDFLVYTNDCADNTNDILNRLQEMGILTRLDNPWDPSGDQKPQHVALKDALNQPVIRDADWVLTIDVDEFLNIHVGDGTFKDLLKAANYPNVMSFTWKFFGNGGVRNYDPDRPVIEQFIRCAPEYIPKPRLGWGFKTMIHSSAPYTKIGVHRPLNIRSESEVDKVRWVNGSGRAMPEMLLTNNTWRSTKRSVGYQLATLNHYVLRSAESFLVKRDRGRVNHTDQDQGMDYWVRRNYNTEEDDRMVDRLPMLHAELDRLLADETLSRLHAEAVAWHRQKIATLRADPGYEALFHSITEVPYPDALYLSPTDEENETEEDDVGIAIPSPEANRMSEEEEEARVAELVAMRDHGILPPEPEPAAPVAAKAPEPIPQPAALHQHSKPLPLSAPPQPPASAEVEDARFSDARARVDRTEGAFLWGGPENALMFIPGSTRLVVTFDNISTVRDDVQREPWGMKFLHETLGCSVLGVMATITNWYRQDFVHDAFESLQKQGFFDRFDEVLFYGASMGGFGALTYARCVPGARVLAIAPQTTLDRDILPNETRWGWTRKLDWNGRFGDAAEAGALDKAADVVVISDPYFAPDVAQVTRLDGPAIRHLRMPFFGHQLPNAFVNMGIMKTLVTSILDGDLTDARFYKMLRARRDLDRFQHDILMEAEQRGHLTLAVKVCDYTLKKRNAGNIRRTRRRLLATLQEAV